MQITEILTPFYEVAWLPWAVQYFWLIGLAAISAIIAACCAWAPEKSDWAQLSPSVNTLLLICAVTAPVSLLADLHQPGRFWHFYTNFTPWSWMSWGAVLLPVFAGLSVGFCALWWLGWKKLQRLAALALIVSAISILIYTGSEVMILRSRPLWHTYFVPINFALTAWLATIGGMILIAKFLPRDFAPMPARPVLILAALATLSLILSAFCWVILGATGHEASFTYAYALFAQYPAWRLSLIGSIVAGLVVVAMLWFWSRRETGWLFQFCFAVLLLGSAWVFRWVIFMSVQGVPKYGAGLYLYTMPLGADGLLGIVGIFGLFIAMIAIVTFALSVFPKSPFLGTKQHSFQF